MAEIPVSDELHRRLLAFKPLAEAVTRESMSLKEYVDFIVHHAIDSLFEMAMQRPQADKSYLTLRRIADFEPEKVFAFVAKVWGNILTEKEQEELKEEIELKRPFGFHPPERS